MVTQLIFAAFASLVVAFVMAAAEASQSRLSRHRAGELVEEARRGAAALAIIVADSAAYLPVPAFVRVLAGAPLPGPGIAELLRSATIAIVGAVTMDRLWHAVPSFPTVSEVWLLLMEAYGL